jgi:hypothetical protein
VSCEDLIDCSFSPPRVYWLLVIVVDTIYYNSFRLARHSLAAFFHCVFWNLGIFSLKYWIILTIVSCLERIFGMWKQIYLIWIRAYQKVFDLQIQGTALVLDEIINHVQSLQRQVEVRLSVVQFLFFIPIFYNSPGHNKRVNSKQFENE